MLFYGLLHIDDLYILDGVSPVSWVISCYFHLAAAAQSHHVPFVHHEHCCQQVVGREAGRSTPCCGFILRYQLGSGWSRFLDPTPQECKNFCINKLCKVACALQIKVARVF